MAAVSEILMPVDRLRTAVVLSDKHHRWLIASPRLPSLQSDYKVLAIKFLSLPLTTVPLQKPQSP
jgi:hypothetical protein